MKQSPAIRVEDIKVVVTDKWHPHYKETGHFITDEPDELDQYCIELENCTHHTKQCWVTIKQVEEL